MPRYIDADAFEADCRKRYCTGCENYNGIKCKACWVDDMLGELDDAPTLSPDEVWGVGEWEDAKQHGLCRCSVCKDCYIEKDYITQAKWKYCPSCGARMKGVSEDV